MTTPASEKPAAASNSDEWDLPEDRESLEKQVEELTATQAATVDRIKRLMAAERPFEGITFAPEIFEAQQEKLRLEVEIDIRRKRIRRLDMTF